MPITTIFSTRVHCVLMSSWLEMHMKSSCEQQLETKQFMPSPKNNHLKCTKYLDGNVQGDFSAPFNV